MHARELAYIHKHTHIHTHIDTHTNTIATYTHTNTITRNSFVCKPFLLNVHSSQNACTHVNSYTYTYTHIHIHTHTHAHLTKNCIPYNSEARLIRSPDGSVGRAKGGSRGVHGVRTLPPFWEWTPPPPFPIGHPPCVVFYSKAVHHIHYD